MDNVGAKNKGGICRNPISRREQYLKEGYDTFILLFYSHDEGFVKMLEAAIIMFLQKQCAGNQNRPNSGGEGPPWTDDPGPFFAYIAIGSLAFSAGSH